MWGWGSRCTVVEGDEERFVLGGDRPEKERDAVLETDVTHRVSRVGTQGQRRQHVLGEFRPVKDDPGVQSQVMVPLSAEGVYVHFFDAAVFSHELAQADEPGFDRGGGWSIGESFVNAGLFHELACQCGV